VEYVLKLSGGLGVPQLESRQGHEIFLFSSMFKPVLGPILSYFQLISAFFLEIKAARK
jgi:hypothetical protein